MPSSMTQEVLGAYKFVQVACSQDPASEVYRKALDMTKKAPELHAELQRQLAASGEVQYSSTASKCRSRAQRKVHGARG